MRVVVGPAKQVVRAGALVRRLVRAQLRAADVDFTEDKGLFESCFVVTVPAGATLDLTPLERN